MQQKRNNKIYLRATIISICIILANQLFIQYWLYQKKEDAEIINIAGKQRMISQRLVNLSYASINTQNSIEQQEIKKLYKGWENTNAQLTERFKPEHLPLFSDMTIHKDLIGLTPLIEEAKKVIEQPQPNLKNSDLEKFRLNQDEFLNKMNAVVSKIEINSRWKLNVVIWIEILVALISLFMIYFEITFIFKKINQNLETQNAALGESNQMLEQYAYLAAHDLRSPTQNIINFSKLLQKKLDSKMDATEKNYFQFITESAERMQNTTSDLLMFSSINHEKITLEYCEPSQVLKNVMNDIKVDINEKKAKINIENCRHPFRQIRHFFILFFKT